MNLNIYDLTFKKLGDLVNEQGHSAKGITVNEKMNEIWGLSFSLRDDNPYFTYVINGNLVQFDNQLYEITDVSKQNSANDGVVYSVSCKHFAKTLQTKIITEAVLDPVNATDFMDFILNGYGGGELGWGVGTIDSPSDRYRAIEIKEQSVFQTIAEAAERYDCWVQYDAYEEDGSIYLTISMYAKNTHIGSEAPFTFYERKHIKNISVSRNTDEMATRLYAFGGTNPSTGIDVDLFDAIVGGVPYAKTYVEDYSYFLNQGYSQSYINDHPELFRKEATWRDSNYLDANTLYQDALKQLAERAVPKITVNMTNIMKDVRLPEIGEQANVVDTRLNENLTFTIEGRSINYDSPWEVKYQVSNVVGYRNFITDLHKSSIKTRYAVNDDGTVRREAVRDVIQTTELVADYVTTGILKSQNNYSWINLNNGTFSFGNGALAWNGSVLSAQGSFTSFGTAQSSSLSNGAVRLRHGTTDMAYFSIETLGPTGPYITAAAAATRITFAKLVSTTLHSAYTISYPNANSTIPTHTFLGNTTVFGDTSIIGKLSSGAINADGVIVGWRVEPHLDNNEVCGTSSKRWQAVYAVNGTIQTSGLKDKENIKSVKSKDVDNIKTISAKTEKAIANEAYSEDVSIDEVYEEDFIDLLDLIAAKECTYNYKTKEKKIPQSSVQLGVIADEISEHKAYKYIGVKETLEDGTVSHGLQPLPIAMLAIQGYGHLRDKIAMLENELKELKGNKK